MGISLPDQFLSLTDWQLNHLKEWADGNYEVGVPSKPVALESLPLAEQPHALDSSALEPTIGGGFQVYDKDDQYFAEVKGNLIGFDYRFLTADGAVELGRVTKQIEGLSGIARKVFFSADHYLLQVNSELSEQPLAKMLLLATALAIDLIYKSESRTSDFDISD